MINVFALRAIMVDGSSVDLLLFEEAAAAEKQKQYIEDNCTLFGYDKLSVVARRIIGKSEPIERRKERRPPGGIKV